MSKFRGSQGGACAMARELTSDWKICKQSQIAFSTQSLILEGFYFSLFKIALAGSPIPHLGKQIQT